MIKKKNIFIGCFHNCLSSAHIHGGLEIRERDILINNLCVQSAAVYPIVRKRGLFGEVSVSWVVEPSLSGDVSPIQGTITFKDGEYLQNLTLFSVPDEV